MRVDYCRREFRAKPKTIFFITLERSVLSLFTTKKFLVVKSRKWRINKTMSLRYREYIASISRVYREFIANVAPLEMRLPSNRVLFGTNATCIGAKTSTPFLFKISPPYTRDILAIYSRYNRYRETGDREIGARISRFSRERTQYRPLLVYSFCWRRFSPPPASVSRRED